ncbi:MAG: hypothetical protein MJ215_03675 [Spirochaetia bacterium]|nr:hypothetical protein [Spirochaetia bacterium]
MLRKFAFLPFLLLIPVLAAYSEAETVQSEGISEDTSLYNMNIGLKVTGTESGDSLVNSYADKTVFSGRPVHLNLKGSNFKAAIQLTLFNTAAGGMVLLAQSTVFCRGDRDRVLSTVKSIPVNMGEKILFFPLGVLSAGEQDKYECLLEINITDHQQPVSARP